MKQEKRFSDIPVVLEIQVLLRLVDWWEEKYLPEKGIF
jgi:hypothetical protein